MAVTTAIAIYFLIWWVVLFAVLPWGVRSQAEHGDISPGSDPGAPSLPRLALKLVWTSLVAGLVFGALYVIYARRLITLEDFTRLIGMPR
jgi:predicted secreted protein